MNYSYPAFLEDCKLSSGFFEHDAGTLFNELILVYENQRQIVGFDLHNEF